MSTEEHATQSTPSRRIAFIHNGSFFHLATLKDPAVLAYDVIDVYAPEMTPHSLDDIDAVFIAARLHKDVVKGIAPYILEFLSRQDTKVYVDGENNVGDWLPGTTHTHRGTNFWAWRVGEDVGRRSVNREHYLWRYLDDRAVHWHYHAVLTAPQSATPLVVLTELPEDANSTCIASPGTDPWGGEYKAIPGHPNILLYHDSKTFQSEIVVSTMDCTYHHGSGFMPGATQLLYRILRWLAA